MPPLCPGRKGRRKELQDRKLSSGVIISNQNSVFHINSEIKLTIGLSLPDSIRHTPQSRKDEEDAELVGMRFPEQEGDDTRKVGQSSWK